MNNSDTKSLINNLTAGPLAKQILLFSLPLMLGNFLHALYNIVDMAIVGQWVGSVGLSAVSVSGQITILFYCLGIGLGSGSQILVSQQVGAGEEKKLNITIGTTVVFTFFLSVAVMILGLIFAKPMLSLLNTPEESMQEAVDYINWCMVGIPFVYMLGGLGAMMRGFGDSKHPTLFTFISCISNIVLDLLLVAVFGMRSRGAAIATTAAQAIGVVFCFIYLFRHKDAFPFDFKKESFRMDPATLKTIIKLSAPLAFQTIAINVSFLFITGWVNAYGLVASAVNGVGSKLNSIVVIVTNAMETACATFAGQNIAAGRKDRVRKTMLYSTLFCVAVWLFITILIIISPELFFLLFTKEADVLAWAPAFMKIQIVMYLGFAFMSPPIGFINGIGNVSLNFIIAMVDGVVARIGLGIVLAQVLQMGVTGYWWGTSLAGFVSVIWGWIYFFSKKWEDRSLLV